ncbi:hypothetical protein [Bacteroides intestinalis]|uniref:Class IIb bacteriocin, lactobin A/cerein 7B family n=1 Tax=Bacteroides intestinalis TaxID=329854 RepID=A0A139L1E8_9BACE|nr:hypothetical protein [Bacteroides intestinalis]KXT45228.1 hypothetical protein HMPREF2531_03727 [Bacteroides intestinalis]
MDNNLLTELNAEQIQNIDGGSLLSTITGFVYETVVIAAEATWDFISEPKIGGDTLMNCI